MEERIGQLTGVQIGELKKKHGQVYAIEVKDAQGAAHVCYVKKPTRQVLSYAMNDGGKNPIRVNSSVFDNCWLAGAQAIKDNDAMYLGASGRMGELVEVAEAELVKL